MEEDPGIRPWLNLKILSVIIKRVYKGGLSDFFQITQLFWVGVVTGHGFRIVGVSAIISTG
eukprot:4109160-Ditylum_brightwellii.AAC.1